MRFFVRLAGKWQNGAANRRSVSASSVAMAAAGHDAGDTFTLRLTTIMLVTGSRTWLFRPPVRPQLRLKLITPIKPALMEIRARGNGMKTRLATLAAMLAVAGCVQTQELPLAANIYRLESSGSGLFGASRVPTVILRRAAELTISKGYTHFLLTDAGMQSGSRQIGNTPVYGSTTASVYGNTGFANTTVYGGQPIYAKTAQAGVTVVMYVSGNMPDNALDATQVLAELKK